MSQKMTNTFRLKSFLLGVALIAGASIAHADADLAIAGSAQCDDQAFYDALGQSESGGCGGGNQYNCMGPIIKCPPAKNHCGDRPIGKYQFMPKTLIGMGINPNTFAGNAAAQEQAIRRLVAQNNSCLDKPYTKNGVTYPPASSAIGTTINGVKITRSGLLGAAHLSGCGGARRMIRTQSAGSSDQLGTSALGYAGKFQDYGVHGAQAGITCGGGVPNAADIFAQAQANGLIGCDPAVYEHAKNSVEALRDLEAEAIKAAITQPTPIEQQTCFDQHAKGVSEMMKVHSKSKGGNGSDTIGPAIEGPFKQRMQQFLNGNMVGSITNIVNQQFTKITQDFNKTLSSLTGGLAGKAGSNPINMPTSNCDMTNQAWLIAQCIQMPSIPSLANVVGGKIAEITGVINDIGEVVSNPDRLLQKVCSKMDSKLQGMMGDALGKLNGNIDKAADGALKPLNDATDTLTNL